jgi:hypothetical protein
MSEGVSRFFFELESTNTDTLDANRVGQSVREITGSSLLPFPCRFELLSGLVNGNMRVIVEGSRLRIGTVISEAEIVSLRAQFIYILHRNTVRNVRVSARTLGGVLDLSGV